MNCTYRVDSSHRITAHPSDDGAAPAWLKSIHSEEIGDGIRVNHFDFVADADMRMQGVGTAVFCVAVFVDGRGSMSLTNGSSLSIEPGTTMLFHSPHRVSGENRIFGGSHIQCLDFRFSPEAIEKLGAPTLSALIRSSSADCSVQDTLLLGRPTPPAISGIAHSILSCGLKGKARRLYLQAKALEVLAHIVAESDGADRASAERDAFSRRDEEKIRAAMQLLAVEYRQPWTIPLLSRRVGLNERKLKQGFRYIVGRSVRKYLEDARMRAAARILADDGSVTEAALAVGYENLSHFAKRFREHYGMLPSYWRKSRGVLPHALQTSSVEHDCPTVVSHTRRARR